MNRTRRPVLRHVPRGFLVTVVLAILAVTLQPSESGSPADWDHVFCIVCGHLALADGLANVALFLPLGVALAWLGYGSRSALLTATSLSLAVELAQLVIPGRDPSVRDVVFNILGAALGGAGVRLASRWARPGVQLASRLSLVTGVMIVVVFVLTDVLLEPSLPERAYFAGSAALQSSPAPLRLGGNTEPGEHFRGRIDDVRIYRRAQTPVEIEADMNTPVGMGHPSPDLVAAYSFDQGNGVVLADLSGHGNTGRVMGATWTSQGKFGGALVFDGPGDVVVVPHSASLDLVSAMTLAAWIYPTASQPGRRAILQKEYDAYFLLAGSQREPLRPGAGGTFGWSTESVDAPSAVPTGSWTHVAITYDGTSLELYVNGRPAARRQRWYPGGVDVALDGLALLAGTRVESGPLRAGLLAGAPLRIRAVAAAPVPVQVPLVTLHDAFRNEILLLAAEGNDVVFRLRTRAAAAALDSPAIRARGVLRDLVPGDDLTLTVSRAGRRYCVSVNARSVCELGFTLGMGWAFFVHSQVPSGWPHAVSSMVWMAALLFPFGFWMRRRWESVLGAFILVTGAALTSTIGGLNASLVEIGAATASIVAGRVCAVQVERLHYATRETDTRPLRGCRHVPPDSM